MHFSNGFVILILPLTNETEIFINMEDARELGQIH